MLQIKGRIKLKFNYLVYSADMEITLKTNKGDIVIEMMQAEEAKTTTDFVRG